jgi:predicted RNA methylase
MNTKEQVLQNCTIQGNVVKLPNIQLERKLYQEVAKSLNLIGGKWTGGKVFGFVFQTDPTDLLDQIANGDKRNLKKEFQFFATPNEVAEKLVMLANDRRSFRENDLILEPSAGQGAIVNAIHKILGFKTLVFGYELMDVNRMMLTKNVVGKFELLGEDFLSHDDDYKFDVIIANPPFSNNQDIDHIQKMYNCLNDGGIMVSIASNSWTTGERKKQASFRDWLSEKNAEIESLSMGTFKESGTLVGAKIIIIQN